MLEIEISRFEKSLINICANVVLPPPEGAEKMINLGLSGAGEPKTFAHSVARALCVVMARLTSESPRMTLRRKVLLVRIPIPEQEQRAGRVYSLGIQGLRS